tara:strand:- start:661 stop:1752 length:1092 start_codon:yes stop_codon:yes gene_type:complete
MHCHIHTIPIDHPGDVSGLRLAIDNGDIRASEVIAILGKTEGNGCVNDFTRAYMASELKALFREYLGAERAATISMIMSGGTEGVLSPHLTIVSRSGRASADNRRADGKKAFAAGVARTPVITPAALGREEQIRLVSEATKTAMVDAGIVDPADVHFVQVKCPLLVSSDFADSGGSTITTETYKSMAYSRGASALGIAIGLGESGFTDAAAAEGLNCTDFQSYSAVASASAGAELDCCEVVVMGNSPASEGDLFICHDVMADALDVGVFERASQSARALAPEGFEVVQILAKAEADPSGRVRGYRNTMLDDSDINHTRHARSVVGAVLAAATSNPMIYVSGGAEHQGPPGGGPLALIARRSQR